MKKNFAAKVKVFFMATVMALPLALSGCGSKGEVPDLDGYEHYTNETLSIDIQYPEDWLALGPETLLNLDEFYEVDFSEMGMTTADIAGALAQADVIWYDFDNMYVDDQGNSFTPNANMVFKSGAKMTQSSLKNSTFQSQMEAGIIDELSLYFDITMLEDSRGVEIGNNYFFMLKYSYNLFGMDMAICQAMTVSKGGSVVVLTYTDLADNFSSSVGKFETMIATLLFL